MRQAHRDDKNPIRILIADSQHISRRGLRGLLETRPGWEVVAEAEDGYGAMDAAMRTLPDVAILDCALPRMNGLESAHRILQQLSKTELCVFAHSAEESALISALHCGVRGVILKSDAEEELLAAVEAVSKHQSYVSCAITNAMTGDHAAHLGDLPPLGMLTPREREIIQLVAEGLSNKQIGKKLALSIKTVECHRGAAMRKAGWSSIVDLVRYAVRNHLVQA
ncbi:MAG TPA: response regulator transcription factor [Rhizomicrobium sp.]|nr:response regulator transcription factor [Rhizomicrobium sp.]